jgi:hypothetical protein
MEFFVAIHVPEKFGLRPGFIGNSAGRQKGIASFNRVWCQRFHRQRVAQPPFDEMAEKYLQIHRRCRVVASARFFHKSTPGSACIERILAAGLFFVQIAFTFDQCSIN